MAKKLLLKMYEIKTASDLIAEINLPLELKKKLEDNNILNDRFLQHNELDVAQEGDVIGKYEATRGFLFGTILRIKRGEATHITLTQLEGESINLEDLASSATDGIAGSLKDYGYFCMTKTHLALTSGHISRKAFQSYINYLLCKPEPTTQKISLEPMVNTETVIPMSDVRSIAISESYFSNNSGYDSVTEAFSVVKNRVLLKMLADAKSLRDIEADNILSATIRLRLRISNRSKKTEENKKVLSALFQSADSDDVVVATRTGKKIKGGVFEIKKEVEIDFTDSGFPHKGQLETEMRNFLKEVQKK